MNLREIYSADRVREGRNFSGKNPVISFEVFPPKNDFEGEKLDKLLFHLKALKKYNPAFVSLTYGAGGSSQAKSFDIIKKIKALDLNVMTHFTCVGTEKAHIKEYLSEIQNMGIENILALRGDIPEGMNLSDFDFHYANELVEFIKSETDLSIAVAGYPEGHIECNDLSVDLDNLKRKVDAGADAIFTQMFFDNDKFFNFVQSAQKAGINVPIIPGILPITSYASIERMLSMARVSMPEDLKNRLEGAKDDSDYVKKLGIEFATHQCQQLIEANVLGLHFYTINSSVATGRILDNLGVAV